MARGRLAANQRIATRFYGAIGVSSFITLVTVIVAWQSFERVHESQRAVFETALPETEFVVDLARTTGALVAIAPQLTAANSVGEFDEVVASLAAVRQEFETKLESILFVEEGQASHLVAEKGDLLIGNVEQVKESMISLFGIRDQTSESRQRLAVLEQEIRRILLPEIDDQFFYAMTGRRELGDEPTPREAHFSEEEFHLYRYLSDIEKQSNLAIQLLATSAITTDVALISVLTEQFNSSRGQILTSIMAINRPGMIKEVVSLSNEIIDLGTGENSIFTIREAELRLLEEQRHLVRMGQTISEELIAHAQDLVREVNSRALQDAQEAERVLDTARVVLVGLGVSGILAAIAISWLLVGRVLIARLRYLSSRMRAMARGMLDEEIVVSGNDEIAEMASALEIFRQRSLEAQRLNLVEVLADELQEKNEAMQKVVDELQTAQNQIVMREKLAALGELTAGVAHEIKNPLNFVKNFSESSRELVIELGEIIDDEEMSDEERAEEMKSIGDMLIGNFDRILEHGARAVRIVNDMLRMGRDSGIPQETDINLLVEQHAKLAYHGIRAAVEELQVRIDYHLDPEVGDAVVVSQEIGRVILNLVGNSCYATHEKRRGIIEEAGEGVPTDYSPRIDVTTRNKGELIEIVVRDNGSGIPDSLKEKIFNPFFTTKPTDQGTGLGLAMSSDIVQKHGGRILVDSKDGEFTEMTVLIARNAVDHLAEEPPES